MNKFMDNEGRMVTIAGMAKFQNECKCGRHTAYFYVAHGKLDDGTEVEIVFHSECSPDADERVHGYTAFDDTEYYVTPYDIVQGLKTGDFMLAYCGDGTPTELAKEAERMRATGDYDDDVPWGVD